MSNDQEKKQPSHDVFVVAGDDTPRWVKIGAAFPNKDGKGFNLTLDAFPAAGGRMVMREFQAKGAGSEREAAASNPAAQPPTPT